MEPAGRTSARHRARPERHGRPAGVRATDGGRRAAGSRGVGSAGGHVLRRRRPRPDRQGRARPAGRAAIAGGARRPECPAAARRERPGEHDLRLPARRAHVPRRDAGAPRAHGRPIVPDDRGRGLDPARRRRRGGRHPGRRAAGVGEGPRGAVDRRRLDPRPAGADRRHPRWWRPSRPSCACASSSTWRPRSPARCPRRGACSRSGPCSTRRRPSAVPRGTSPWRSSTSTRASTAAGTPGRSAGWRPTGTASCASRCGAGSSTTREPRLFAGCGIVADSDPDAEWEESRIKLRAVVSALGIPGDEP